MSFIMLFPADAAEISVVDLVNETQDLLGLRLTPLVDGKEVADGVVAYEADGSIDFGLHLELPELEEDEGEPIVQVLSTPRLDRDEDYEELLDALAEQAPEMAPILQQNGRDIVLSSGENSASLEAARAVAYVLASMSGSGVLVIEDSEENEEESITVWFANAEEFADAAFGEDDDDDDEDDEEGEDKE